MHGLFPYIKALVFIMVCFWSVGCGSSPPTKFYLLSPLPAPEHETTEVQDHRPTIIRLDAVVIPGYLDRPEIVTRISKNEIHLADLNQWGEPLRNNLTNILALNLSRLLPAERFAIFPFKCPTPVDYQVSVEIVQMDGGLNGDVYLTAQWSILKRKESNILVTRKSRFKASKLPTNYGELVAAQSRLLEVLSREIAKNIQEYL